MDKLIDSRFERVETALNKLIQSIASYNPSTALATDLVLADNELTDGLKTLTLHQTNHHKILSLREEADRLDSTIRDSATSLIKARRDLLDTPATTFPSDTNPVSYSDLLLYARRISKFTLPPADRGPPKPEAPTEAEASQATNTPNITSQPPTNGTTTPLHAINGIDKDTTMSGTNTPSQTPALVQSKTTDLPEPLDKHMNDTGADFFVPWPSDDQIRHGALGKLKLLQDQGIDPAKYDPAENRAEEERQEELKRKEVEMEKQRAEAEEERRREEHARRAAAGAQPRREQGGAETFALETFDDDEDDDDE